MKPHVWNPPHECEFSDSHGDYFRRNVEVCTFCGAVRAKDWKTTELELVEYDSDNGFFSINAKQRPYPLVVVKEHPLLVKMDREKV